MGAEQHRPISWEKAVLDWYDTLYAPLVEDHRGAGHARRVPRPHPRRSLPRIMDHGYYLSQERGTDVRASTRRRARTTARRSVGRGACWAGPTACSDHVAHPGGDLGAGARPRPPRDVAHALSAPCAGPEGSERNGRATDAPACPVVSHRHAGPTTWSSCATAAYSPRPASTPCSPPARRCSASGPAGIDGPEEGRQAEGAPSTANLGSGGLVARSAREA